MEIGNKLRVLRTEKGFTQEKIADLLQMPQASYSNLENNKGKIDLKTIQKIAEIYEIQIVEILKNEKVSHTNQNTKRGNNGVIINQLSQKLIEQYEIRLKEKDEIIAELRKKLE
jgi:transcriptional regulator with XRE-family HTH domain